MHFRDHLLILITSILLFIPIATEVNAQTRAQQIKLNQLSRSYSLEFQREKEAALKRADSLGIPVRQEYKDGRTAILVRFKNGRPVYKINHNASGAELIKTNEIYSGGEANLALTGSGQTIGLWDAGNPKTDHQELNGRVTVVDPLDTDGHTTHVAGTLIASGVVASAKGMAPSGTVESYDFEFDQTTMPSAAANGLAVSVHPYGYQVGWVQDNINGNPGWYWRGSAGWEEDYNFGFYDADNAKAWDEIAFNAPHYLIVASAGNDRGKGPGPADNKYEWDGSGWVLCNPDCTVPHDLNGEADNGGTDGYDTISDHSLAKNIITVGAINGSKNMWINSNWGPTDDGRIKPDIVAKGVSVNSSTAGSPTSYGNRTGTSHSAPMIAGSAALLLEHQQNLNPDETLLSSTLKALILHTAEDLWNTGPDYQFGWGVMNTQKAAEVMSLNNTEAGIHIKELTLHENETISFSIKATGSEPLRATIAWTDPPGTPISVESSPETNPGRFTLVNDLDIKLADESPTTFQPFILDPDNPDNIATTGDNFRDNIEMIHIDSPDTDQIYTVTITHKNSLTNGSQDFSLIITGNEGIDYEQQIAEGNGEGWRFLSSPVSTTYQEFLDPLWTQGPDNSDGPAVPLSSSNVLMYDGSAYTSIDDLNTDMTIGSGIAVNVYPDDNFDGNPNPWPKTITATGMETIGDVDVSDLLNTGNKVYTLLGNPYNSTIDFDNFTNLNQVGGVVYVYDHSFEPDPLVSPDEDGGDAGGIFRAWNGSAGSLSGGLISSFQGFFVFATGTEPSMTIPESAKTATSTDFYKEINNDPVLQISAKMNDRYYSDTWFSFTESGSLETNENDAPYLYPLDYKPFLSLRSATDETGYLIKNLPVSLKEPLQIPITIEGWQPNENEDSPEYIPMGGTVEIVWPKLQNIPPNWTLTLTDHQNSTIVDLEESSRYAFTLFEPKAKRKSLPHSMKMKTVEDAATSNSRFTLTIYPEPLAQNHTLETPSEFVLHQNYPNPFNPSTVIRYSLPNASNVELDVFTVDGQKVATLVNGSQHAGNHTVTFNGANLSSGVYIYRFTTDRRMISRKMVIIK